MCAKHALFQSLINSIKNGHVTMENVNIKTTGTQVGANFIAFRDNQRPTVTTFNNNWPYKYNIGGGHALAVTNGNVHVTGCEFTATQGNAILVRDGDVTINGGVYVGADSYSATDSNLMAGPAASYGIKTYGGNVTIYSGTFGPADANIRGSGAYFMGRANKADKVIIYGGHFTVSGQAGISIYNYGDVLIDPTDAEVVVSGFSAGIAIENTDFKSKLNITGGTYKSLWTDGAWTNAIWCGNDYAQIDISGGSFVGHNSGMVVRSLIEDAYVNVTGGTFGDNQSVYGTRLST